MSGILIKSATFVRADTSPSANPGSIGDNWTDLTGNTWQITSDAVVPGSEGDYYELWNAGHLIRPSGENFQDGYVTLYPKLNTGGVGYKIFLRYQDPSNFYGAYTYANGQLQIVKRVSGNYSSLMNANVAGWDATTHYLKLRVVDNVLTFTVNLRSDDSVAHILSVIDSDLSAAGSWGIDPWPNAPIEKVEGYTEDIQPLQPGVISRTSQTPTTVHLSATDATDGVEPYTYQWYRSQTDGFSPDSGSLITGATARTLVDTDLTPEDIYYYVIRYTDAHATTADSDQFTQTMPAAPPAPVVSLTVTSTLHVNDVGDIELTVVDDNGTPVNLSGVTAKSIVLSAPSGVASTYPASFVTDGTDGKLKYTLTAGDLNTYGIWSAQAAYTLSTGEEKHSNSKIFNVSANL